MAVQLKDCKVVLHRLDLEKYKRKRESIQAKCCRICSKDNDAPHAKLKLYWDILICRACRNFFTTLRRDVKKGQKLSKTSCLGKDCGIKNKLCAPCRVKRCISHGFCLAGTSVRVKSEKSTQDVVNVLPSTSKTVSNLGTAAKSVDSKGAKKFIVTRTVEQLKRTVVKVIDQRKISQNEQKLSNLSNQPTQSGKKDETTNRKISDKVVTEVPGCAKAIKKLKNIMKKTPKNEEKEKISEIDLDRECNKTEEVLSLTDDKTNTEVIPGCSKIEKFEERVKEDIVKKRKRIEIDSSCKSTCNKAKKSKFSCNNTEDKIGAPKCASPMKKLEETVKKVMENKKKKDIHCVKTVEEKNDVKDDEKNSETEKNEHDDSGLMSPTEAVIKTNEVPDEKMKMAEKSGKHVEEKIKKSKNANKINDIPKTGTKNSKKQINALNEPKKPKNKPRVGKVVIQSGERSPKIPKMIIKLPGLKSHKPGKSKRPLLKSSIESPQLPESSKVETGKNTRIPIPESSDESDGTVPLRDEANESKKVFDSPAPSTSTTEFRGDKGEKSATKKLPDKPAIIGKGKRPLLKSSIDFPHKKVRSVIADKLLVTSQVETVKNTRIPIPETSDESDVTVPLRDEANESIKVIDSPAPSTSTTEFIGYKGEKSTTKILSDTVKTGNVTPVRVPEEYYESGFYFGGINEYSKYFVNYPTASMSPYDNHRREMPEILTEKAGKTPTIEKVSKATNIENLNNLRVQTPDLIDEEKLDFRDGNKVLGDEANDTGNRANVRQKKSTSLTDIQRKRWTDIGNKSFKSKVSIKKRPSPAIGVDKTREIANNNKSIDIASTSTNENPSKEISEIRAVKAGKTPITEKVSEPNNIKSVNNSQVQTPDLIGEEELDFGDNNAVLEDENNANVPETKSTSLTEIQESNKTEIGNKFIKSKVLIKKRPSSSGAVDKTRKTANNKKSIDIASTSTNENPRKEMSEIRSEEAGKTPITEKVSKPNNIKNMNNSQVQTPDLIGEEELNFGDDNGVLGDEANDSEHRANVTQTKSTSLTDIQGSKKAEIGQRFIKNKVSVKKRPSPSVAVDKTREIANNKKRIDIASTSTNENPRKEISEIRSEKAEKASIIEKVPKPINSENVNNTQVQTPDLIDKEKLDFGDGNKVLGEENNANVPETKSTSLTEIQESNKTEIGNKFIKSKVLIKKRPSSSGAVDKTRKTANNKKSIDIESTSTNENPRKELSEIRAEKAGKTPIIEKVSKPINSKNVNNTQVQTPDLIDKEELNFGHGNRVLGDEANDSEARANVPQKKLTSFTDIQRKRWIEIGNKSIKSQVSITKRPSPSVAVDKTREMSNNKKSIDIASTSTNENPRKEMSEIRSEEAGKTPITEKIFSKPNNIKNVNNSQVKTPDLIGEEELDFGHDNGVLGDEANDSENRANVTQTKSTSLTDIQESKKAEIGQRFIKNKVSVKKRPSLSVAVDKAREIANNKKSIDIASTSTNENPRKEISEIRSEKAEKASTIEKVPKPINSENVNNTQVQTPDLIDKEKLDFGDGNKVLGDEANDPGNRANVRQTKSTSLTDIQREKRTEIGKKCFKSKVSIKKRPFPPTRLINTKGASSPYKNPRMPEVRTGKAEKTSIIPINTKTMNKSSVQTPDLICEEELDFGDDKGVLEDEVNDSKNRANVPPTKSTSLTDIQESKKTEIGNKFIKSKVSIQKRPPPSVTVVKTREIANNKKSIDTCNQKEHEMENHFAVDNDEISVNKNSSNREDEDYYQKKQLEEMDEIGKPNLVKQKVQTKISKTANEQVVPEINLNRESSRKLVRKKKVSPKKTSENPTETKDERIPEIGKYFAGSEVKDEAEKKNFRDKENTYSNVSTAKKRVKKRRRSTSARFRPAAEFDISSSSSEDDDYFNVSSEETSKPESPLPVNQPVSSFLGKPFPPEHEFQKPTGPVSIFSSRKPQPQVKGKPHPQVKGKPQPQVKANASTPLHSEEPPNHDDDMISLLVSESAYDSLFDTWSWERSSYKPREG